MKNKKANKEVRVAANTENKEETIMKNIENNIAETTESKKNESTEKKKIVAMIVIIFLGVVRILYLFWGVLCGRLMSDFQTFSISFILFFIIQGFENKIIDSVKLDDIHKKTIWKVVWVVVLVVVPPLAWLIVERVV